MAPRPVRCRYFKVFASTGNSVAVAPNSGDMFDSVARSAIPRLLNPGPKNSTNLPTTPWALSIWVRVRTRSVAVVPGGSVPRVRTPRTIGFGRNIGWPSIAASASMPPTPQPSTPRPLIIGVCESVPTTVSGKTQPSRSMTT
jgi:hypothetical protein